MTLKTEIEEDINNVFLDPDDFADTFIIDGKSVTGMVDDDALKERQGTNDLSVSDSTMLFFAPMSSFSKRKVAGEKMTINGKIYVIDSWLVNLGMAEIALHRETSN